MLSLSFNRKLLVGFILPMLLLVLLSAASYRTISAFERADDWVSHTLQVIVNTQRISSQLAEAHYNKQLYLLTHDTGRLQAFNTARPPIRRDIDTLKWLVRDNAAQARRIESLDKYVTDEFYDDNTVIITSRPGSGAASIHNLNETALTNINACRTVISQIITAERKLLVSRKQIKDEQANSVKRTIIFYTIISLFILAGLLTYIIRTFNAIQRLKDRLQLSESKFSKVFSDSGIGMAIVSLQGRWLDVNPYLLKLLGYRRDELLKKTFQEITHPDDLNTDLNFVSQLLKGEIDSYKMEKRYFHKNGHVVWALLTVSLIYNEDDTPRFFVAQLEDIGGMKKLISELEVKNSSLSATSAELKSKVDQLHEFNRIVAHNLRGPAGSIRMMIDIYMDERDEKEKDELLRLIRKSSVTLNDTLADLMQVLETTLNQSIAFDSCDLNEVLEKTRGMLQGEILRTDAVISTAFEVTVVRFPRIYLESLFYNMVSNALKYKKNGTPVHISISSASENERVKLVFEDNGLGIDLQQHGENMFKLNKIFHQGYDSRGVGLFITKNQLETHGGSIAVESEPDLGTKFIVYI